MINLKGVHSQGCGIQPHLSGRLSPKEPRYIRAVYRVMSLIRRRNGFTARAAAVTQPVMAWRVARDCEINFNGRGNVKSGDRLLRGRGLPPQVSSVPQALAPVTLRVPRSPQPSIVCGGKQMCHLQAMEIQDLELTLK